MKYKLLFAGLLSFLLFSCDERKLIQINTSNKEKISAFVNSDSSIVNIDTSKIKFQTDSFVTPTEKDKTIYPEIHLKQNKKRGLDSLFLVLSTKPQFFVLNTREANIIEGKKGTVLYFPENAFGNIGEVKVSLKESYSNSSYLFNCLSTQTSEGENLETAGMIEIKAYSMSNKELSLTKGKSIKIGFPVKGKKKPGFRLFNELFSTDSIIEWENNLGKNNNLRVRSVTLYCQNDLIEFSTKRTSLDFLNKKDVETIKRRMDYSFSNEFPLRVNKIVDSLLTFKRDGYEEDLEFYKTLRKVSDNLKGPFVEYYPKLRENSRLYFRFSDLSDTVSNTEYNEKFLAYFAKEGFKNFKDWELERYILNSNKLGWINCDRFYNDPRQKVNLSIVSASENENFMLYLKETNSAVRAYQNGEKFFVRKMPKGALGTILGVRFNNGKIFIAKKNIRINAKPIDKFKYKEIAIGNLEAEINKLSEF